MNLFEKIFNYQIMSRLEDSGIFTFTSQERAWLKTMLQHSCAAEAFSPEKLGKLKAALVAEETLDLSAALTEKGRSIEKPLFHPLLRPLRRAVANRTGLLLTCRLKDGRLKERECGYPFKLEYSMVKKEWYLLWYHLRFKAMISTKLNHIVAMEELAAPLSSERVERILADIGRLLEQRKRNAIIEVIREYNRELSRILYAFSCFQKEIEYDDLNDRYLIRLTFQGNESEYVLSKIRFLGRRVKVVEGLFLRSRMVESATKALARYGES